MNQRDCRTVRPPGSRQNHVLQGFGGSAARSWSRCRPPSQRAARRRRSCVKIARRMRQYLVRLSAAWCDARNGRHIVIFDQGYVQAISSILLSQAPLLDEDVMTVLAAAPPSDLAIHVSAPASEIEARLKLRGEAIGRLGRMFESELGAAPDHVHAAQRLVAGLRRVGRTVLEVDSANAKMLGVEIDRLQLAIDGLWRG